MQKHKIKILNTNYSNDNNLNNEIYFSSDEDINNNTKKLFLSNPQKKKLKKLKSNLKLNSIYDNKNSYKKIFSLPYINQKCKIKYISMTQKGTKSINQDNYLIKENILNIKDYFIFSIFDGHGIDGYYISKIAKNEFNDYFTNHSNLYYIPRTKKDNLNILNNETDFLNKYISIDEIYTRLSFNNFKIIKNFYNQIDNKLKKKDCDSDFSGTTNCSIFIIGNHLICSNLGDSRAILIRKNNEIYNLSNDHKPNIKNEYERIIKKNGEIRKNNIDINNNNNFIDYNEINLNIKIPFRVFLKNKNIPGLAMSRSIGDFIAKKVGVINEPEILDIIINDNDKFIILASDGLWEFVSNEDVRDIVNKYYKDFNLKDAIKDLINFAIKKFENVGKYIDDITIILIFLNVEE